MKDLIRQRLKDWDLMLLKMNRKLYKEDTMDHVAIMNKRWKLIPKILDRTKTIESRWYKAKIAPWDRIKPGDTVYFKNSGEPVTARAKVEKILQFSDLTQEKVSEIYRLYGKEIGADNDEIEAYIVDKKGKRYCILVFLKEVQEVVPFDINKKGFGISSAWMTVEDIEAIKAG